MTKSARPVASASPRPVVALAACAFQLTAPVDGNLIELQLTPAGYFRPRDGRPMSVTAWYIDEHTAQGVLAAFSARKTPPVVDYEHQTLHKETNGQPAPAAAWMRALQWRDTGLWATAELTERAADLIRSGEYLYISPVFHYDESTGVVLAIEMAALTNNPAIDDMAPLAARAAATFALHIPNEENPMNKLLAALVAALGLAQETTEDQAIAACASLKPQLDALNGITALTGAADAPAALAACTALKAANSGAPDPAKYVGVEVVELLKSQVAALSAENTQRKVDELVDGGLADGRLLPAQKDWAISLGKTDIAALTGYLASAAPIAALSGSQTGGQQPAPGKNEHGLTGAELAICSATGIDPKDFAAAKPQA